jgi:8-oxo-dGTP pyrophosphatase MutT (NUDIX family)
VKEQFIKQKKWKTLDSTYLYQTTFGNLRIDTCETPTGLVIEEYVVHEYADWVNAFVLTEDHKVVLVEQYRHAGGDFFLEIPAGKLEANETLEEGILREVREETGYFSRKKPVKLGEYMVNPATQNNKVATFLIEEATKDFEQDLDETEDIKVHLIDFDKLGELLHTNQLQTQLFTAYAYYMTKDFLIKRRKPV